MPKRRPAPVSPAALAEMALVSDLVEGAAAVAAGGLEAGQALIQAAGQKLEALLIDDWERVFGLALEVVARRRSDDREQHLRALAEVVMAAGNRAGAVEPNEGEKP